MIIQGDGVAARCCGFLLNRAGYRTEFEQRPRVGVPAIMLGERAQKLIRDVFEQPDLFRDAPKITRRIVAWGTAEPVELAHAASIVSEELLLNSLARGEGGTVDADWTIHAKSTPNVRRFGRRNASMSRVELLGSRNTCWIEALDEGWLFLIPDWLIAVGAAAEELLPQSRLIRAQIGVVAMANFRAPASPMIANVLGGSNWIACGSAAMALDPICGDGTAYAVREAILASAMIRAAEKGEDKNTLLDHYEGRLISGFERHLEECLKFYSSGGSGAWWRAELQSIQEGLADCAARRREARYRLNGFDLERLD